MMRHNKDTILGKIIYLTETLEGSKLEEEALSKTNTELAAICEYLGTDEITAIFFSVIFVLQNQRSMSRNEALCRSNSLLYCPTLLPSRNATSAFLFLQKLNGSKSFRHAECLS